MESAKPIATKRKSDKRKYPRVLMAFNKAAIVPSGGARLMDVTIGNISRGGALFHSEKQFSLGDQMTMHIAGVYRGVEFEEQVAGKIVTISRRSDGNSYGLQFSMLVYADHAPALSAFLDRRRRNMVSFLRDPRYGKAERKH